MKVKSGVDGYKKLDARTWPATKLTHIFPPLSDASKGAVFYDITCAGNGTGE